MSASNEKALPVEVHQRLSPHHDERPDGGIIDLMVVHAISLPPGHFGGGDVEALFMGTLDANAHPFYQEIATLRVSAHFVIGRTGRITQYVPVLKRAWHAGVSVWQGRERCNDFSVGVELEGDEQNPFEEVQYHHLARLFRTLQAGLKHLHNDNIAGHQHIAPDRKWDPGPGFDWHLFKQIKEKTSVERHMELRW